MFVQTTQGSKKLKARPKPSLSSRPLPWFARPLAYTLAAVAFEAPPQVDMTVTSKVDRA